MTTPDPDPATTTGLEPGGGTPPGETPPGESSTSASSSSSAQPRVPGRGANRAAAIAVVAVGVLAGLFFIARLTGVLG